MGIPPPIDQTKTTGFGRWFLNALVCGFKRPLESNSPHKCKVMVSEISRKSTTFTTFRNTFKRVSNFQVLIEDFCAREEAPLSYRTRPAQARTMPNVEKLVQRIVGERRLG